jgi:Carboxypeptidase regulatory-like domain
MQMRLTIFQSIQRSSTFQCVSEALCVSALSFSAFFCGTNAACAAQKSSPSPPSYRIAGQIVDASTNIPIPNAELSFSEEAAEMKVTSDEQGRFLFESVDPGKYTLQASAYTYVTEAYNQHHGYSTAIAVGPGLDSEHVLFRLHRQAVIVGTVTDERGEPVRDAQVLLFTEDRGTRKHGVFLASSMQTDDLGAYRFARLQAGKYFVAVSAHPWYARTGFAQSEGVEGQLEDLVSPGFIQIRKARSYPKSDPKLDVVYPVTFFPSVTDEHSASELLLNPGDTQEADVRLQAVPSVHLQLTNVSSDPNNGLGLSANRKFFDGFAMGIPLAFGQFAPGQFEVAGLPPGDITLVVNSNNRNGESQGRTIHANVVDGETFDMATDAPAATVSGKVLSADGATSIQGTITLTSKDGHFFTAILEKSSAFSFPRVEPGAYEVNVNLGGDADYVNRMSASGAKTSDSELKIEGTDEVHLVVQMGRGVGEIKGLVQSDGKPQPDAMVLLIRGSGENLETYSHMDQSDSDGTFILSGILPGNYLLMALDDWDFDWQDPEILAPYRAKAQPITIGANDKKNATIEEQRIPQTQQPQTSEAQN